MRPQAAGKKPRNRHTYVSSYQTLVNRSKDIHVPSYETLVYELKYTSPIVSHANMFSILALASVNRHKLKWCRHVARSSGLAKTILQGKVQGGRRRGRQRKRWEDNIKEWTGLEWNIILPKAENSEEWRKLVVKSTVVPPNGQPDYGIDKKIRRLEQIILRRNVNHSDAFTHHDLKDKRMIIIQSEQSEDSSNEHKQGQVCAYKQAHNKSSSKDK